MSKNVLKWVSVGGGAWQSEGGRFYIQTESRYLGRKAGKSQTERWATITDRVAGGKPREVDGVRSAKALCEKIAAEVGA